MDKSSLLISSRANPRIKELLALRERRERDRTQRFLIEGYRELLRAVEGKQSIESLFSCPELFLGENEEELIRQIVAQGAKHFVCTASVFQKISYRDRPDGLLGVGRQMPRGLDDLARLLEDKKEPPFLIIAEAIEKPGNLGTILRSADAAGAHALILCDRCTDLYNPNVVRASVGTLFTVPVFEAGSQDALKRLREWKIPVAAATPSARELYTEVSFLGPCAIAVGTEQLGLSDLWMKEASVLVRIPMQGHADSLNVATATTLLLFEVVRQRSR